MVRFRYLKKCSYLGAIVNCSRKTRRTFLATGLTTALGIAGCSSLRSNGSSAAVSSEPLSGLVDQPSSSKQFANQNEIPLRQLGRTNIQLPILGLGTAGRTPLARSNQEQAAIEQIERALALGIRYFDTAASYGPSESFLGKVLPAYRADIFLGSKTAARDYDGAWCDLEQSLQRLNTDYLDLWQFHHVAIAADLDTIFSRNGAVKALEEAKEQGLVRFSGITGHYEPDAIVAGLQRYQFDHALIPVNAADIHHPRPFISSVLPVAIAQNVGITAMKVPAYGRLLKPGVLSGMDQALGYTLSQPGVHCAIIAAETLDQLEENVRVAQAFQPLPDSALTEIEQQTTTVWQDNNFFRAWT